MPDNAAAIVAPLLDWIAKGFVILGLAFLADLLLRRANASLRHLIWLGGFAAVMLLPAVSWALPHLDVPIFRLGFLAVNAAGKAGMAQRGLQAGDAWSAAEILLGVYLAGGLLVSAWQLVGRAYAARLRKRARKIAHGELTRELQRLKAVMGIHDPVGLLSSDLISIPFSTGCFRPAIVLPQETASWPAPVLESVLIHELAHIKRRDIPARVAAQIGCCVHWINPLAWYGFGRIMMEQEIACDNLVLGTGTKASDYARNLLALSGVRRGRMDFALTAFGRRTELKSRLVEILKPTRDRAPLRIGVAAVILSLTLGLVLPVAALQFLEVPKTVTVPSPSNSPSQTLEKRTLPVSAAGPAQPNPTGTLPDLEQFKAGISKKIKEMKEQGVAPEEIAEFTTSAKAKLEKLQTEKAKQADEKKKQMELPKSREGKKGKEVE